MDGILLINKEKNYTSRDIVNLICKKYNTTKVGHTGTLDPIAEGLLVICIGDGLKLVELLTGHDKDYIAKVKLGIKTDTYDVTGKIVEENHDYKITKEELIKALNHFNREYYQEVPIYSSVKVNGVKLYKYARANEKVTLPKHLVKIDNIKLLDFNHDSFTFSVTVSSGTYIRSLINDISNYLNIPMSMEELKRTRVGNYLLDNAYSVEQAKVIPIINALTIKKVEVTDDIFYKKIANGVKIPNIYNEKMIMFIKNGKPISIYEDFDGVMKSYRVFKNM